MRPSIRCVSTAAASALLFGLGCGTPAGTTRAVSQAELAVRDAAASEADDFAPAELRLARAKLAAAEQAAREGDHERARRLAEQALVDAELAEVKAESRMAAASVHELEERAEAFRRSLPLGTGEIDAAPVPRGDGDVEIDVEHDAEIDYDVDD
jgi:hypothetical protein